MKMSTTRLAGALPVAGLLLVVAGCTALLGLRDDYRLADDAGQPDAVVADARFGDVTVDPSTVEAPRLLSPLTTATTSIQAPTMRWQLPPGVEGAHVEICSDRACKGVVLQFDALGSSGKVPKDLAPGLYFWRVHGHVGQTTGSAVSPTWEFWARKNSGVADERSATFSAFPDFNGDGLGDILASGGADKGGTDIFLGAKNLGPSDGPRFRLTDPARQATDGIVVSTFGDIDGDGFTDLVVATQGPIAMDTDNHIVVYRGGPTFDSKTTLSWTIPRPAPLDDAGTAIDEFAGVVRVPGDVNGDGYEDIFAFSTLQNASTGPTFVFFGHASGPSTKPDAVLYGDGPTYRLSPDARVGDVNGDGYDDALLSSEAGRGSWLYLGGPQGPSEATRHALAIPADGTNGAGSAAEGAGDLDGDGYPDFIVTTRPGDADAGTPFGKVFVYRGQPGPGLFTAAWTLAGDAPKENFGTVAAIVGDVNGDGFDDAIIGAPFAPNGVADGRAYFYPGSAGGVSDGTRNVLTGSGGWFGARESCAGDVDGNGVLDALVAGSVGGYVDAFLGRLDAGLDDASPVVTVHAPPFIYFLAGAGSQRKRCLPI